jgi:hypothetical protein
MAIAFGALFYVYRRASSLYHATGLYVFDITIIAMTENASVPKDLTPLLAQPQWIHVSSILPMAMTAVSNIGATALIGYKTWCVQPFPYLYLSDN